MSPTTFDPRTEGNLTTLLPPATDLARKFLVAVQASGILPTGVTVRIISATRTYEEQTALYAQGRTRPGPIVTNAKAGQSGHNFKVAFDVGLFRGSDYLEESPLYEKMGPIGESVGLEWGGRWATIDDEPHYQLRTGLSIQEMDRRTRAGTPLLAGTRYEHYTPSADVAAPAPAPNPLSPQWMVQFVGGEKRTVDASQTGLVRWVAEQLGAAVDVAGKVITVTPKGEEAVDA